MKQGLLIDMDGVIYSGEQLIQGADKFIATLLKKDIPFTFMTNNSQRTRLEAVRKLKRLGIEVPSHVQKARWYRPCRCQNTQYLPRYW